MNETGSSISESYATSEEPGRVERQPLGVPGAPGVLTPGAEPSRAQRSGSTLLISASDGDGPVGARLGGRRQTAAACR